MLNVLFYLSEVKENIKQKLEKVLTLKKICTILLYRVSAYPLANQSG